MTALLENIHLALPEMIVLVTACVALLCDLFFRDRCPAIALTCSIIGLIFAGGTSYLFIDGYSNIILNGLYVADAAGYLMKLFICVSVLLCFCYAAHYNRERKIPSGDYYILGLFSTLGMMALVSSHSLITIYLGLELVSLPLYAMTAMRRSDGDSSEAALKYFVMGAIASGMLLFGISLLYGATGQLNLHDVANAIALKAHQETPLLSFALVFIIAGVGFKLAAVPFHMWAPDVYEGAPTSVTLFISSAPKIAAFGMTARLLTISFVGLAVQWQQLILILALLSVGVGSVLAIAQTNIKRLFAYSTIAHLGYVLLGVLAASDAGFSSSLYYVLVYALMSAAAFGLMVIMSKNGVEITQIDDLKGLNKRNPWLAFLMLIVVFSMAGVPPTVGFFAKLLVLKALVDVHMIATAVFGLIFAVVGGYYYLRIIKVMYFDDCQDVSKIEMSQATHLIFSANCLVLLALGVFPSALVSACMSAFAN